MTNRIEALTEKEKATLRLLARGHDAKSIARHLDLSVHTVNERLRDARRKLAVSSSREAARLLLEREETPESFVRNQMGEAEPAQVVSSTGGAGRNRLAIFAIGGMFMTLALALLALVAQPQVAPTPAVPVAAADPAVEAAARRFLVLVDQGGWAECYRLTGEIFRKLNTEKMWVDASEKVRPPLGTTISRTFVSQQNLPAPPNGFELVTFRTSFANKAGAEETVTLEREADGWKVVGITVG